VVARAPILVSDLGTPEARAVRASQPSQGGAMRTLIRLACLMSWLAPSVGLLLPAAAHAQTANACGCYQDPQGACHCNKKSKCGCPDECEPVGCEKKRMAEENRQAELELRRIAAKEKKRSAEAAKEMKEKRARQAREKSEARAKERKARAEAKDEVDSMLK
jgi:hypothetical protein